MTARCNATQCTVCVCGVPAHRLDVSVYEMACVQRVHPFQKLVGYLQNCVFVRILRAWLSVRTFMGRMYVLFEREGDLFDESWAQQSGGSVTCTYVSKSLANYSTRRMQLTSSSSPSLLATSRDEDNG